MTREDIIRMAREAGFSQLEPYIWEARDVGLERFYAKAVASVDLRSYMSWQEGYAAGVAEEQEKYKYDIHTCGPTCPRYACVATRKAVEAAVLEEREALCEWIEREFASYERADKIVDAIRARGDK